MEKAYRVYEKESGKSVVLLLEDKDEVGYNSSVTVECKDIDAQIALCNLLSDSGFTCLNGY